jgi:hypothetical protein
VSHVPARTISGAACKGKCPGLQLRLRQSDLDRAAAEIGYTGTAVQADADEAFQHRRAYEIAKAHAGNGGVAEY